MKKKIFALITAFILVITLGGNAAFAADATPPGEVSELSASFDTLSGPFVSLSWTRPTDSDFDHANIYRDGVLIGNSNYGLYEDYQVNNGVTYTYKITTVDQSGNESSGITRTVNVTSPTITKSYPNVTSSSAQFEIVSDQPGTIYYKVLLEGQSEPISTIVSTATGSEVVTANTPVEINLTGLSPSTSYRVSVVQIDNLGNIAQLVNTVPFTTSAVVINDYTAPVITGPTVSDITTTSAKITITSNEDGRIFYKMLHTGAPVPTVDQVKTMDDGVNPFVYGDGFDQITAGVPITYNFTNFAPGKHNRIYFVAEDVYGNDTDVYTVEFDSLSLPDATAPAEVTNVLTTPGVDLIDLSWANPADSDFSKVNIYVDGVYKASATGSTYGFYGLTASTAYNIKLTTVDTSGNESAGVTTNVTTLASSGGGSTVTPAPSPAPITSVPSQTSTLPAPPTPATPEQKSAESIVKVKPGVANNEQMKQKAHDAIEHPALPTFKDTNHHWAKEAIGLLQNIGAVHGYPDGDFKPNKFVTRAEFVTLVAKLLDIKADSSVPMTLSDVNNNWAAESIQAMVSRGIIHGYNDGTFKPEKEITRSEMVAILLNILDTQNIQVDANTNFKDIANDWNKEGILKARALGIINGKSSDSFAPSDFTTRAEAAQVLLNMLQILK